MKTTLTCLTALILFTATLATAQEPPQPTIKSLPASVIKTVPASGDAAVDAATTTQIKVTFSKPMKDGSWSWSQISDETFLSPLHSAPKIGCAPWKGSGWRVGPGF